MKINELTIKIYEGTQEPGYFYDIYNGISEDPEEFNEILDGGFCTTTIENALEMAYEQTLELIKNSLPQKKNKLQGITLPEGVTKLEDHSKLNGSCLQGGVRCTYKRLNEVFDFEHSAGDEYKTDAEWAFNTPYGVITIYNYKDGYNYLGSEGTDVSEITEWHIGGFNKESADFIINLINNK